MKNIKLNSKRNPKSNYSLYKSETCGENLNLRRKSLAILDTKIKTSFSHLNTLLDKINNTKDLVINNKFDIRDVKSLKNLDNNALILSHNFRKEAKNATKLALGYNLSAFDLDTFIKELRKKKKKIEGKKNLKENKKDEEKELIIDNFENYKNEFNLAHFGKNKHEKIKNNSFLKNQKRMRDLYNLKLELNLIDQKKKIGEKRTFDEVKRAPNCLIDRDKRKNPQYQRVKSKYFEMYQLSKSFEIEDELIEKNILNEEYDTEEEKENNNDIFLTNDTKSKIPHITKKTILKEVNQIKNSNFSNKKLFHKKKKSFSAKNIKCRNFNNSAIIVNSSKNNANNNSKQSIRLKLKSGININKKNDIITNTNNDINSHNNLYSKIYKNNFINNRNRNIRSKQLISNLTSKPTLYSSKSSSRPLSSFSSFNNTTYHFNKTKVMNKTMTNLNNNLSASKNKFKTYVSEINKILRYSDYTTEKFKKSTNELNKKKLFIKSTNKIFERKKIVNIDKIIKNLNLDKNPHSFINDKKLIYNNSLKVKLMLNLKNREILNTVILTLFDEQRRVNKFFIDQSLYEKLLKKFERNKVFNLLSNKIINFEKKHDKEQILDMFDKGEENIEEFMKNKEIKKKFDEDEYKFVLIKNKNMKLMDNEKNKKMNLNGNLYKKHLVAKYKKID